MDNFRIRIQNKKEVIVIRYYDTAYYKTLLRSLNELLTLKIPKRAHIVLDFSEVKSFIISYRQIINFKTSIKTLLKVKAGRIAIINAPKASWGGIVSIPTPPVANDPMPFDIRSFGASQRSEAYSWI